MPFAPKDAKNGLIRAAPRSVEHAKDLSWQVHAERGLPIALVRLHENFLLHREQESFARASSHRMRRDARESAKGQCPRGKRFQRQRMPNHSSGVLVKCAPK